METQLKLKLAAGAGGALLITCIVLNVQSHKRDKKAAVFFSELERIIAPSEVGLVETPALDIQYWQKAEKIAKKPIFFLKQAAAVAFAKDIYGAIGYIYDDEKKIYSTFRALRDKVAASQVAYWYYQNHKVNLIDHLRANLNTSEVEEIMKIVNKLPPYRIA